MFAYCGNNPINYLDYSGDAAVSIFLKAILSGALSALVEYATGGSIKDVVFAFAKGAVMELLSIDIFEDLTDIIFMFELCWTAIDCVRHNCTFQELILVIGVALLSNIGIGKSADELANLIAEFVFGAGSGICATGIEKYYTGDHPDSPIRKGYEFDFDYRQHISVYSDGGSGLSIRSAICIDAR